MPQLHPMLIHPWIQQRYPSSRALFLQLQHISNAHAQTCERAGQPHVGQPHVHVMLPWPRCGCGLPFLHYMQFDQKPVT